MATRFLIGISLSRTIFRRKFFWQHTQLRRQKVGGRGIILLFLIKENPKELETFSLFPQNLTLGK